MAAWQRNSSPPEFLHTMRPSQHTVLEASDSLHNLLSSGLDGSKVEPRCMTARDRLRAWNVKFFGSSNLTHKSCGIFVASWGFAHCIGTRLVFHNFLSHRKEDKWSNAKQP